MRFGAWWGYVYAAAECTLIWPDKLLFPEYPTIYITLNIMPATREQLECIRGITDADNVEHLNALGVLLSKLAPEGCGPEEFEALLGVLERSPLEDGFESYWSILHFLEACEGYEPSLLASLERQPAELSLTMINRMMNAGINTYEGRPLLEVLASVARRSDLDERLREVARGFIEYQRAKQDA